MKTQMMQFRVNDEEKALIEKCAKKAGIADFHFHDLRHTCATRMVQA